MPLGCEGNNIKLCMMLLEPPFCEGVIDILFSSCAFFPEMWGSNRKIWMYKKLPLLMLLLPCFLSFPYACDMVWFFEL